MDRTADHLARDVYASLGDVLSDLVVTSTQLTDICRDQILVNTNDLAFLEARLVFLSRGALDHVKQLSVIPHATTGIPQRRHLRSVDE